MAEIKIEDLTIDFYQKKYHSFFDFLSKNVMPSRKNRVQEERNPVLDHINLTIKEGDILGIIGRNGIGKSSLLKAIAGIYPPTGGKITVTGNIHALIELGGGFDENQTALENIYLLSALLGENKKQIEEKIDGIVEFSELGDKIHLPLKNYSSGMRSRLFFSIATEISPDILILDEVFATGDAKFNKKAIKRIKSVINDSKIVLMVSHNRERILELCTRCIVLDNGKIAYEGSPEDAFNYYESL